MDVKIEQGWKEALQTEFKQDYFLHIVSSLKAEKQAGRVIYPPGNLIFSAFEKPLCYGKSGAHWPGPLSRSGPGHGAEFFRTPRHQAPAFPAEYFQRNQG